MVGETPKTRVGIHLDRTMTTTVGSTLPRIRPPDATYAFIGIFQDDTTVTTVATLPKARRYIDCLEVITKTL